MVRYSAMSRERIAGAIAPWAVETAAEVDAFAPNQGAAPPGLGSSVGALVSKSKKYHAPTASDAFCFALYVCFWPVVSRSAAGRDVSRPLPPFLLFFLGRQFQQNPNQCLHFPAASFLSPSLPLLTICT